MKKVVLFDFHNTLATCDGWLELEIETLPGLALARLAERGSVATVAGGMPEQAIRLFKTLRQRVRESGVELSAVEGTRQVLAEMGVAPTEIELESVVRELELACLAEVRVVEGAGEALGALRDAGYTLGVVSSAGYPPFVELALEELGLRAFFQEIVTSAGEGIYKSDPEIFRRAVARLGATPGEAVHVGDHAGYDVQTARAAGLSAVWFAAHAKRTAEMHNRDWAELEQAGAEADATIHNMSELFGAIASLR